MAKTMSKKELEREIARQRAALADTLEELNGRMARDEIWSQVTALASAYGQNASQRVVRAAKTNPGKTLAAGAGLAILAYGATRLLSGGRRDDDYIPRSRSRADLTREPSDESDSEALVKVLRARLEALETQRAAEDEAREARRKARTKAARTPLLYGLGALAAGAAVSALRGKAMSAVETALDPEAPVKSGRAAAMDAGVPTGTTAPEGLMPNRRH